MCYVKKIGFRFHRSTLKSAMKTYKEFDSFSELFRFLNDFCKSNYISVGQYYVNLYGTFDDPLGADSRIGWTNTFIVGLVDGGVLGFLTLKEVN